MREYIWYNAEFRIENSELLDKCHLPVMIVFNMVSDSRFIKVLEGLSNGMGFGENYGACVFWNDLDDYDKANTPHYEGSEFGINSGEEVIISYQDLFYYLTIICKKYCLEFPEQTKEINEILNNYKLRYEINK